MTQGSSLAGWTAIRQSELCNMQHNVQRIEHMHWGPRLASATAGLRPPVVRLACAAVRAQSGHLLLAATWNAVVWSRSGCVALRRFISWLTNSW